MAIAGAGTDATKTRDFELLETTLRKEFGDVVVGDVTVTFEGTYASYVGWRPSALELIRPAARSWHLVYGTPSGSLDNAMRLTRERNAGYVYVTPDVLPNPWDTLPPAAYWTREIAAVRATALSVRDVEEVRFVLFGRPVLAEFERALADSS